MAVEVVTAYLGLVAFTSFEVNNLLLELQIVVAWRSACRESSDSGLEVHHTIIIALQATSLELASMLNS